MSGMDSGARMESALACLRVMGYELADVARELGLDSVELEYDHGDGEVTMRGYDDDMNVRIGFTTIMGEGERHE